VKTERAYAGQRKWLAHRPKATEAMIVNALAILDHPRVNRQKATGFQGL